MEKHETDPTNNLIPFPNLNTRLLEKGVQLLRKKDYRKAMDLFEQLLKLEPLHSQGAYGLAVCYVELEHYEKAETLTDSMMKQGIGNYYDVLKLHLTILIQQHDYEKVVSTIQAVLSEDNPPPEVHETLVHLSDFAQIRMTENIEEHPHKIPFSPNIKEDLESQQVERQWQGIQKGKTFVTEEVVHNYIEYLKSEVGDPFLKSMVIQILIENGHKGPIQVRKFDSEFTVDLKETQLFFEGFSTLVKEKLDDVLASNNPSLLEVSKQIWEHFAIAVFPKQVDPNLPNVWAAACFVLAHQLSGMELNLEDLEIYFDVTKESIARPLTQLKSIEERRSPL